MEDPWSERELLWLLWLRGLREPENVRPIVDSENLLSGDAMRGLRGLREPENVRPRTDAAPDTAPDTADDTFLSEPPFIPIRLFGLDR